MEDFEPSAILIDCMQLMMKEDLDEYVNGLAVKRGCPVDSVNRNKAHWDLIMNRKACMEERLMYL